MKSPELLYRPGIALDPNAYVVSSGSTVSAGPAVDCLSFEWIEFRLAMGANDGPTVTMAVQESANGSTGWTLVPGSTLTFSSTEDNTLKSGLVRLATRLRFLRMRVTVSGTDTTLATLSGTYTLINPAYGSDQAFDYSFQVL